VEQVVETAIDEGELYREAGFDALIVENMHDRPYLRRRVGPEVVAAMTVATREVVTLGLPVGVQVLAGANRESLAVALAAGAAFVRVEGFVFSHVADEGWMDGDAGTLLRYRKQIGAESLHVFADVKKKHAAHAVTADVGLAETAQAAELFLADGLIVTGAATGRTAAPEDLEEVKAASSLPVLIGSGITADNLDLYAAADGWIVGSSVKRRGLWSEPLDRPRLDALVAAARCLRDG
jgi:membrane complex biogenesis BtpA family protein